MGKQKRILFLDQLKAISILLIVYGHNDYDSGFSAFVSTFRLPLFFMPRGAAYMDWGILLWFLPALFCVLLLDYGLSRLSDYQAWGRGVQCCCWFRLATPWVLGRSAQGTNKSHCSS